METENNGDSDWPAATTPLDLRNRWGDQAASDRMDPQHASFDYSLAAARLLLAPKHQLRFIVAENDYYNQGRSELAARDGLSEPVHRDAIASVEGVVLHEEHQGPASIDPHSKTSKAE